jgi:hypothetical protein
MLLRLLFLLTWVLLLLVREQGDVASASGTDFAEVAASVFVGTDSAPHADDEGRALPPLTLLRLRAAGVAAKAVLGGTCLIMTCLCFLEEG